MTVLETELLITNRVIFWLHVICLERQQNEVETGFYLGPAHPHRIWALHSNKRNSLAVVQLCFYVGSSIATVND